MKDPILAPRYRKGAFMYFKPGITQEAPQVLREGLPGL